MWLTAINLTVSSGLMSSGAKVIKASLKMMDLEDASAQCMHLEE